MMCVLLCVATALCAAVSCAAGEGQTPSFENYVLDYGTPTNPALQMNLKALDATLRGRYGMTTEQVAVGVLDLTRLRLAMIHPDRIDYAASVAKVGILLAYFQLHPEAATNLDPQTRHELGLMAKASSNEMAAKYSREMGLTQIQQVLNSYHFYDTNHGGGIWVGRHYGGGGERIGDPIAITLTPRPCANCSASSCCSNRASSSLPQPQKPCARSSPPRTSHTTTSNS